MKKTKNKSDQNQKTAVIFILTLIKYKTPNNLGIVTIFVSMSTILIYFSIIYGRIDLLVGTNLSTEQIVQKC